VAQCFKILPTQSMILCSYFNIEVWGFCYLRIFKKRNSISGRSSTFPQLPSDLPVIRMNNKIIFNIYLVDLSEQTSKETATFEITKNGIISPKTGEQIQIYRIFVRERKKFLLPAMNEIWFVMMSENFQSNCNLEGYGKLTGRI
jgi:hypothetical protein